MDASGRADAGRRDSGSIGDDGGVILFDAGPTTDDAGVGPDTGIPTDAATLDAGSTLSDGGGTDGGGTDAGGTDAGGTDAGTRTLSCGAVTCTGADICCITFGAGGAVTTSCAATCGSTAIPVSCFLPSDCGGNPCCATITDGALVGSMCTATANGCRPMLNVISQDGQTRGCVTSADCTSGPVTTSLDACCTYTRGSYNVDVCFDPGLDDLVAEIDCP